MVVVDGEMVVDGRRVIGGDDGDDEGCGLLDALGDGLVGGIVVIPSPLPLSLVSTNRWRHIQMSGRVTHSVEDDRTGSAHQRQARRRHRICCSLDSTPGWQ